MGDKRLSANFTLHELTRTDHNDLRMANRAEGAEYEGKLRQLCLHLMQKIRNVWGPITITSGYRGAELNKRVGSTDASQHRKGEACDFVLKDMSKENKASFLEWCKDEADCSTMVWHQLLDEGTRFHISLPTGVNDNQIGTWTNKKSGVKSKKKKK